MGNEKIIENLLDVIPFACVLMADTFKINYMNPVMLDFFSIESTQNLTDSSFLSHLHEKDRERFKEYIDHLDKSEPAQDWKKFSIVDANEEEKVILFNGITKINKLGAKGVYLLVGMPMFEDDVEKNLNEDLEDKARNRFSSSKYESIIENAAIGISVIDSSGIIEDTNQTFAEQVAGDKDRIIGKHFSEFFNKKTNETIGKLLKKITENDEALSKSTLTIPHPDNTHHILEISISRIRDVKDHLGKYMVITEDITDQTDTHAALLQSEKLALTGRLAASLAHEINNPLQTSIGCLGLAEEMLDEEDEDLRVYLEMAIEELQRSARIVKKLRDLNRKSDPSEKFPINLREVLEEVLVLTKNRLYDRNIVPIFPYQGPPPYALASRDQIHQVLLNIIMNAIDAIPNGGNIYLDLFKTKNPQGYEVRIRDTGEGISPEIMDHLFDPFFTTKEEGLGLGLYISKDIIEQHDGSIKVDSVLGQGTTFSIWLPGLDIPEEKE